MVGKLIMLHKGALEFTNSLLNRLPEQKVPAINQNAYLPYRPSGRNVDGLLLHFLDNLKIWNIFLKIISLLHC